MKNITKQQKPGGGYFKRFIFNAEDAEKRFAESRRGFLIIFSSAALRVKLCGPLR
jgi:hypothetical protein